MTSGEQLPFGNTRISVTGVDRVWAKCGSEWGKKPKSVEIYFKKVLKN